MDRREKLTETQREEIGQLRRMGLSYRSIAERFGVSKKLVIMITNPDIAERNRLAFIARKREGRYKPTTEERTAIQREHRQSKKACLKEVGVI